MKKIALGLLLILWSCPLGSTEGVTLPVNEKIIFLAPNGDDAAQGDLRSPLRTLRGVLARLKQIQFDGDVTINCISNKGTFHDEFVAWDYSIPDHSIAFRAFPSGTYARFEMTPERAREDPFFCLLANRAARTNLVFDHLAIANYNAGGIWFIGGWPASPGGSNGNNRVSYCVFDSIGNMGRPQVPLCYGIIDCVTSVDNVIENCTFHNCRNAGHSTPPIVAIYLAHNSSRNTIRGNTFREIEGNGVKLRDHSNANRITNNLFIRTGKNAGLLQVPNADVINWYCDESLMELDCGPTESPSDSNVISDNTACGDYYRMQPNVYVDAMMNLMPCVKCNPCVGIESTVTLFNNSVDTCSVNEPTTDARDLLSPR